MTSRLSISSSSSSHFVIRLTTLVAFILVVQLLLGSWTEASFPELSALDRHLAQPADVIYFGDSVLHYYAQFDETRRGIPEMLGELIPGHSVGAVDHPAYHLGLYRLFCEYIRRSGAAPKVIIVPVTLRSFSAAWARRPQYQFPRESVVLTYRTRYYDSKIRRSLLRPLLVFKAFDLRPDSSDADRTLVRVVVDSADDANDVVSRTVERVSASDLRRWLTASYMFRLTADHPRVQDIASIAKIFEGSNTKLIFYITPIDYETGTRLVGRSFVPRLQDNANVITGLLAAQGIRSSDLTFSLGADAFGWRGDGKIPDEHLAENGRRYVANELAESLKPLLN